MGQAARTAPSSVYTPPPPKPSCAHLSPGLVGVLADQDWFRRPGGVRLRSCLSGRCSGGPGDPFSWSRGCPGMTRQAEWPARLPVLECLVSSVSCSLSALGSDTTPLPSWASLNSSTWGSLKQALKGLSVEFALLADKAAQQVSELFLLGACSNSPCLGNGRRHGFLCRLRSPESRASGCWLVSVGTARHHLF